MELLLIIITLLVFILLTWAWQETWLPCIIDKLREPIKPAIEKMRGEDLKDINESKELEDENKKDLIKEIRKEEYLGSERHIPYRTRELAYITKIVGWGEIIFFATLIFFTLKDISSKDNLEKASFFFTILGGWIFIKAIVNYDQWSHKKAGKAYFYISIFGTLLNIIFAISVGIFYFFFS